MESDSENGKSELGPSESGEALVGKMAVREFRAASRGIENAGVANGVRSADDARSLETRAGGARISGYCVVGAGIAGMRRLRERNPRARY